MRSVTKLIKQIRNQTENEEFGDFTGINDTEFIQYLNDAQYNLQSIIVAQHPNVFIKETIITVAPNQQGYNLPSDCFLNNKVNNVEFSATGKEDDYYVLDSTTIKNRDPGVEGYPNRYIRYNGKILLTPIPSNGGTIKVNYIYRLPELGKRAAQIGQKTQEVDVEGVPTPTDVDTVVSSSENFSLTIDNSTLPINQDLLSNYDYFCIVDKEGRFVIKNIEIDTISFNEVICKPHTLDTGEPFVIPVGSYIVGGKDTTSHSELGIETERYLISYCAWKILKRDSSVDSQEAMAELQQMAQEIVNSYKVITDDVSFIPDLNSQDRWIF